MRILTFVLSVLVLSACTSPKPATNSPDSPAPVVEAPTAPAPASPQAAAAAPPPSAETAPTPAAADQTDSPGVEQLAAAEGTHSAFAVLKVKDAEQFAASLDRVHPDLERAGAIAYVVSQGLDQRDVVITHIVGRSGAKLKAFIDGQKASPESPLAKADELFVASDDAYDVPNPWPAERTFSVFLRFKVKDFDKWYSTFDKNGELRAPAGVIGYGVHRAVEDERVVVHYLAKSTDVLRQLADQPEFKRAQKAQGVQGNPKPFFAIDIRAQKLPALR